MEDQLLHRAEVPGSGVYENHALEGKAGQRPWFLLTYGERSGQPLPLLLHGTLGMVPGLAGARVTKVTERQSLATW